MGLLDRMQTLLSYLTCGDEEKTYTWEYDATAFVSLILTRYQTLSQNCFKNLCQITVFKFDLVTEHGYQ